jgi:hypothetical protein
MKSACSISGEGDPRSAVERAQRVRAREGHPDYQIKGRKCADTPSSQAQLRDDADQLTLATAKLGAEGRVRVLEPSADRGVTSTRCARPSTAGDGSGDVALDSYCGAVSIRAPPGAQRDPDLHYTGPSARDRCR